MTAGKNPESPPMFFILSRPRTGSTLLRTLLDAHPQALVPPECQFIVNLYPRFGSLGRWSEADIRAFVGALPEQFLFDTWKMDLGQLEHKLLPLAGEVNYSDICRQVYLHYSSLFPKSDIRTIGDKNPGYALHAGLLLRLFPEARFIHLYRDYRDNHISLADAGFELPIVSLTTAKWRYFFRKLWQLQEDHPDRVMSLRYEDLVSDPEPALRRVCEFLGIAWRPEVLDFHRKGEQMARLYEGNNFLRFHSLLTQPVTTERVGVWRNRMTPREVKVADRVAGKYADLAGYRRYHSTRDPRVHLASLSGLILAAALYQARAIINRLPWRFRHHLLNHLNARVESLWRRLLRRNRQR